MARRVIIGFPELETMIYDATQVKTVAAVIVVAVEKWRVGKLSGYAFAGLLRKASDKIYSISNN